MKVLMIAMLVMMVLVIAMLGYEGLAIAIATGDGSSGNCNSCPRKERSD